MKLVMVSCLLCLNDWQVKQARIIIHEINYILIRKLSQNFVTITNLAYII